MSSLEVSKLSFVKAQLYGLGFANATFYLSSFKLLELFTFTRLLFTSPTFYSTSSGFRQGWKPGYLVLECQFQFRCV